MATRIERRHYKHLKATSKKMVMGPFECPNCGTELYFRREGDKVMTKCPCGAAGEWPYGEILQPVDYFNKLADELRTKKTVS
jgi:transcription elongation factor Elf1